ncbi:DUF4435 domain-containing protein [Streptococcus mutans]|uniref:DUF4435 domain-containing protein n=1 Tax=Streptococcus mutans TaxID=1309 RepID=UPI0014553D48|nr:DUF4435 domain-containing protein [Streptococcus mutans]NLQ55656.1 DUF4435 domain-containing protein [Streptococcus mutans]
MSDGLRHSPQALHNRQRFLANANDFNLYVEDTGYEFWYKEIFKRMGYRIVSVIASGDKKRVVADYREYGPETDGKLNFYITDGDFWRYTSPEKMILDDCFIYLHTYNIESYFIDENYSTQFLKGRLRTDDQGVMESGFDFDEWQQCIVDESNSLFFMYATIEGLTAILGESTPSFSQDVGKTVSGAIQFLNFETGFVKEEALEKESERIMKLVSKYNLSDEFNRVMQEIIQKYHSVYGKEYYNLICGKYLFTSLTKYIQGILKSNSAKTTIEYNDFKWGCINSFDISKLDYIKDIIDTKLSA